MKTSRRFIQFFMVLLLAGCSPDIADMEADFQEQIEAAFREQSLEQMLALHKFQDEPESAIEQTKQHLERNLQREIESITFEAIPDAIRNSYSAGYEIEGEWYEPSPTPYKSVVIRYKKKPPSPDGTRWSTGTRKLVSMDGRELVFPGMKRMPAPPKTLKIVLPDNFVGKFSFVWRKAGVTPEESGSALIYEIPEDGELEVASLEYLMQERPLLIEYENGAVLFKHGADQNDADGVFYDPASMRMRAGSIGAPSGTSGSQYHGTKLSWEIKKQEAESGNESQGHD